MRKKFSEVQTKRSIIKNVKKAGIAMDSYRLFPVEDKSVQAAGTDETIGIQEAYSAAGVAMKNAVGYVWTDMVKLWNNLMASGVKPVSVVDTILMPEDGEKQMKKILGEIESVSHHMGIALIGGHTEIVSAVSEPVISLVMNGIKQHHTSYEVDADMDIVMCGQTAVMGTYLLYKEYREKLLQRYSQTYLWTAERMKELVMLDAQMDIIYSHGIAECHDVSTGGVYAALWELADKIDMGIDISHDDIPIMQETVEVCEVAEYNPYMIDGSGAVLVICKDGQRLCDNLYDAGYEAAVIGKVTANNDRIITHDDETRFLNPPKGEDIYS